MPDVRRQEIQRRLIGDKNDAAAIHRTRDCRQAEAQLIDELSHGFAKPGGAEVAPEASRDSLAAGNRSPNGRDSKVCCEKWDAERMERGLMDDSKMLPGVKFGGEFKDAGLPADFPPPAATPGLFYEIWDDAVGGGVLFHLGAGVWRGDEMDGVFF